MIIDLHALLEKNPITKAMLKPKFSLTYYSLLYKVCKQEHLFY